MSEETMVEQSKMSFPSRLINVFIAPGEMFKDVKRRAGWLLPLIVLALGTMALSYVMQPVITKFQREQATSQMEKRGMSQEQIDGILEQQQVFTKPYFLVPVAGVTTILMTLIGAAIWLFVVSFILGGKAGFGQVLSVNTYRSFIPLLGTVIKLPIILTKETILVHFSLATFMSDAASQTFLYKFLMNIELFNIWSIAVLCIGLAVLAETSVKKVWPWVVGLYLLWWLGSAGFSTLVGG